MRWVMGRLAKMADVECGGSEAGGGMMEAGEKREEGTAGIKKSNKPLASTPPTGDSFVTFTATKQTNNDQRTTASHTAARN